MAWLTIWAQYWPLAVVGERKMAEEGVAYPDDGPQCLASVYLNDSPSDSVAVFFAIPVPVAGRVRPSPSSLVVASADQQQHVLQQQQYSLLSPPYSFDHAPWQPRQHSISPFRASPVQ